MRLVCSRFSTLLRCYCYHVCVLMFCLCAIAMFAVLMCYYRIVGNFHSQSSQFLRMRSLMPIIHTPYNHDPSVGLIFVVS